MAKTDHLRYRPVMVHALDVLRDCSTNAERLYLRLATGKHATRIGVVVRPHDLTLEARLTVKQIDAALLELRDAELVTLSVSGAVYLTGHCRECSQKSPDNLRSWRDEAVRVLTGSRMDVLDQVLEDIGFREPTGSTTGGATGKPVGVPRERDRERDTDRDTSSATQPPASQPEPAQAPRTTRKQFQIPTEAETRDIFRDLGCPHHRMDIADSCHNHFKGVGWKRGKNSIVDWQATCRTWWLNQCKWEPSLASTPQQQQPLADRRFNELEEARERNRQFKLANGIED